MDKCYQSSKDELESGFKKKVAVVFRGQVVESIEYHAKEPKVYPEEKCRVTEGF